MSAADKLGGIFTGAKAGETSKLGDLPDGKFLCELTAVKWIDKAFKTGKPAYIIEFTVLESDTVEVRPGASRSIGFYSIAADDAFKRDKDRGRLLSLSGALVSDLMKRHVDPNGPYPDPSGSWEKFAIDATLADGASVKGCKFRVRKSTGTSRGGNKFAQYDFSDAI